MAQDKSEGQQIAPPKADTTPAPSATDNKPTEETFFKKNQKVLLVIAVVAAGFFAYKQFNK
jgi:hypothetical protein